jgi:hypothetical protein
MKVARQRRTARRALRAWAALLMVLAVANACAVPESVQACVAVPALVGWMTAIVLCVGAAVCLHAAGE